MKSAVKGTVIRMTIILNVSSLSTDIKQYTNHLEKGDKLVVVFEEGKKPEMPEDNENMSYRSIQKGDNTVKQYNEIVFSADDASDILLLSDQIDLHGGIFDKMHSSLYATEKHAIVSGQEIDNKKSLIKAAEKYLPQFSITIEPSICCTMIKRRVIDVLGFFDDSYNSLRYALIDYHCRINRYGFSSIISHHALFSYKSKKEASDNIKDKKLFDSRYTDKQDSNKWFAEHEIHPCLRFIKLLDEEYYPRKRILFDCILMPSHHCGTTEYQISVFEAFSRLYKNKYDISLYISYEADEFHKLSDRFDNVVYPDTIKETYHLGYAPNQLMHFDYHSVMNSHCLKIIQTMFDIIMVRKFDEYYGVEINADVELGIKLSDGIVFISEYSESDFLTHYANEKSITDKQLRLIYPAAIELGIPDKNDYELPFEEYVLLIGNSFEHKVIKEVIEAVSDTQHNYIIIGYGNSDYISENIYGYMNGHLDDDYLNYLYKNCTAVMYPSLYEGFGLPIVIGLKNKKRVIINNNALNNELVKHFNQFRDYFLFYDRFEQIKEIINSTDFSEELPAAEYKDSWDRVAIEVESLFEAVLSADVDIAELNDRWTQFKIVEAKKQRYERVISSLRAKLNIIHNQFGNYKLRSLLFFAIKEHIKHRYPKLFRRIKGKTVSSMPDA